jgi:hypothetical protein
MAVTFLPLLPINGHLLWLFDVTLSVLSSVHPDVLDRCSKQTVFSLTRSTALLRAPTLKGWTLLLSKRRPCCLAVMGDTHKHTDRKEITSDQTWRDSFVSTSIVFCTVWCNLCSVFQSCNNIYRCNAAEVLLDVYPLEDPRGCSIKNVNLMELQHATMNRLLTDTCHVVRIIAIRVCIQNIEH